MGFVRAVYGAKAQVALGLLLTFGGVAGWPTTALTVFEHEPQGILALSWGAIILSGYNLVATGLGYRAAERIEAKVDLDVEHADKVEIG